MARALPARRDNDKGHGGSATGTFFVHPPFIRPTAIYRYSFKQWGMGPTVSFNPWDASAAGPMSVAIGLTLMPNDYHPDAIVLA